MAIKKAKPSDKKQKLFDGGGLLLEVAPFGGKEKLLSLGAYPEITLKDAREKRDAAKKLLTENQDLGEVKKAKRWALFMAATTALNMCPVNG